MKLDSFTYDATTVRFADEEVQHVKFHLRSNTAREIYFANTTIEGASNLTYYVNGTAYRRLSNGSSPTITKIPNAGSPIRTVRQINRTLGTAIERENFSYHGRTSASGTSGFHYVATDVSPVVVGPTPARNVTVELIVTQEGLVREIDIYYTVDTASVTRRVHVWARLSKINETTVQQPEWVDDA
jgi:hypothetical protein